MKLRAFVHTETLAEAESTYPSLPPSRRHRSTSLSTSSGVPNSITRGSTFPHEAELVAVPPLDLREAHPRQHVDPLVRVNARVDDIGQQQRNVAV